MEMRTEDHNVTLPRNGGYKDRSCIVWNPDHTRYGIIVGQTECPHGYYGDDLDVVWPTPNADGSALHTTICSVSCHWSLTGYQMTGDTRIH